MSGVGVGATRSGARIDALRLLRLLRLLACLLFAPTLAMAQATVATPADRLTPSVGPGLVTVEAATTPAPKQVFWMAHLGWASRPLELRVPNSAYTTTPVRDVVSMVLGAEMGLFRGVSLQAIWPFVLYQAGDRLRGTGVDETPLATTVSGDFVFRLRAAFVGNQAQPGLHLGSSLELTIPFDGRNHFAGRASPSFAIRLHGDFRHRWFGVAAMLGYRLVSERNLFTKTVGDELGWGVGATAVVWPGHKLRVALVAEWSGVVGNSKAPAPAEMRLAARLFTGPVAIDVGGGFALNDEAFAARGRVFLTVRGRAGGAPVLDW